MQFVEIFRDRLKDLKVQHKVVPYQLRHVAPNIEMARCACILAEVTSIGPWKSMSSETRCELSQGLQNLGICCAERLENILHRR